MVSLLSFCTCDLLQLDLPYELDEEAVCMAADPSCSLLAVGAQRYVHLLDARAGAVVHRVSRLRQTLQCT